jgi:hypothetical protein
MAKNGKNDPFPGTASQTASLPSNGITGTPETGRTANRSAFTSGSQVADAPGVATRIAGLSVLKGLVLYGATLTFAGFYAYFMYEIASAPSGKPPNFSAPMVGAAAALAGILGSAFALVVGTPTGTTNQGLERKLDGAENVRGIWLWKLLSIEPGGKTRASYPLTFGIWAYAIVASAVAIVYFLNPSETPDAVKALATAFAGYVVAFITVAYGLATQAPPQPTGADA